MTARRSLLKTVLAAIAAVALSSSFLFAEAQEKTVRIGFQKYGKLVLLKGRGTLEDKLKPLGYKVVWTEFPSGPPLLEALNVGAIDFGVAGETPPIFAQAAGAPLVYLAYDPPAPQGEAILVPKDSKLTSVADLKGKKVALNKGSNVHYLLVRALEKAGLKYTDIQPVFLPPSDALAAFTRGSVDAWVIWDPYEAAAEASTGARILADGTDLVANHQFYFSSKAFLNTDSKAVDVVLEALNEADEWAKNNIETVAEQLSPSVGLPASVLAASLKRESYGLKPISDEVIASQQRIADTFHELGLVPKAIKVSDVQRKPGS
ncbi:sulfonate ABC transporter substrate-binding protein [Bradyrhizobium sp. SYSU BS000235]|uniref:sulfonate ABC transporter substrate-binding protein n=1 Tax=Bradyrhizobium sp. SYSU BS000235 TaxID=3411332 RepID=UPI003C708BE7